MQRDMPGRARRRAYGPSHRAEPVRGRCSSTSRFPGARLERRAQQRLRQRLCAWSTAALGTVLGSRIAPFGRLSAVDRSRLEHSSRLYHDRARGRFGAAVQGSRLSIGSSSGDTRGSQEWKIGNSLLKSGRGTWTRDGWGRRLPLCFCMPSLSRGSVSNALPFYKYLGRYFW